MFSGGDTCSCLLSYVMCMVEFAGLKTIIKIIVCWFIVKENVTEWLVNSAELQAVINHSNHLRSIVRSLGAPPSGVGDERVEWGDGSSGSSFEGCCGGCGFCNKAASGPSSFLLRRWSTASISPGTKELGACPRPRFLQLWLHFLRLTSKPLCERGSSVLDLDLPLLRWRQPVVRRRRAESGCLWGFEKHRSQGLFCGFVFVRVLLCKMGGTAIHVSLCIRISCLCTFFLSTNTDMFYQKKKPCCIHYALIGKVNFAFKAHVLTIWTIRFCSEIRAQQKR